MFLVGLQLQYFLATVMLMTGSLGQDSKSCPTIISRAGWGGKMPQQVRYIAVPVQYVIIAHTATPECKNQVDCIEMVESIRGNHMDRLEWNDIGFNFLIGGDGNIYEGAGWHKEGAHTIKYNKKSIGIAFIGDFSRTLPDPSMLNAAKELIACGVGALELDRRYRLVAQRQVTATISPGVPLFQEIQKWPNWYSQE